MSTWAYPSKATPAKRRKAAKIAAELLGPLQIPYAPFRASPKQEAFLRLNRLEVFYGGSAGPGKSAGLLMGALKYVEHRDYAALILRRTYSELSQPNALMNEAREWIGNGAHWSDRESTWTFPSGATLTFGYLAAERDRDRYKSAEYQFIGIDELTSFLEGQYRFMFSRLRKKLGNPIPLRMRSASNPGGIGHEWVKKRFVDPRTREPGAAFIRAFLDDNPGIDRESYLESLAMLGTLDADRLIRGDWDAELVGSHFQRSNIAIVETAPLPIRLVRSWDLAATPVMQAGDDPDWTVGLLYSLDTDAGFTIRDVKRLRAGPAEVEKMVAGTAAHDRQTWNDRVDITIPEDPGQAGKSQAEHWKRDVLRGYRVHAVRPSGSKEVRARNVSAAVTNRLVRLQLGPWPIEDFLSILERFPMKGVHDDDVDALADAHAHVSTAGSVSTYTPATQQIPQRQRRG